MTTTDVSPMGRSRVGLRRSGVLMCAALASLAGALSRAHIARASSTSDSITMVSEPGDWAGGGVDRRFDTPGTIRLRGDAAHLEVQVESDGQRFTFEFAAPAKKALEDGEYLDAERYPFEPKSRPGLSVSGDGAGCNTDYGRFTIEDIAFNSSGEPERFWALYEQHCETPSAPALFGEVRIGEPQNPTENAEPSAVSWPQTDVGGAGFEVPVTLVAGGEDDSISSVGLEGGDAGDFKIDADHCTTVTLSPGAGCYVTVSARPQTAGPATATLTFSGTGGVTTTVPLYVDTEAHEPPPEPVGGSWATMVSEPGDWVGGGIDRLFDAPEGVTVTGNADYAEVRAEGTQGEFSFEFKAPEGRTLEVGEYPFAERYPFGPKNLPGLSVSGDGRGCNNSNGRFTILDIGFNSAREVDRLWALYEQHCEGPEGPALFGEVRVGEPPGTAPEIVQPAAVQWPQTAVGVSTDVVPITVGAGEAGAQLGGVVLEGADAGDFHIVADECEGITLPANARCTVTVSAKPTTTGLRSAQLDVSGRSGAETQVALSVDTEAPPEPPAGSEFVTMVGEPGNWVGGGVDRLFDTQQSVRVSGDSAEAEVTVEGKDGQFEFIFAAPEGQGLHDGSYTKAERWPFERKRHPGLDISGEGRGCNTENGSFTIQEIGFNESGEIERLTALYEDHCEGPHSPALFGEVRVGAPPSQTPEKAQPGEVQWPVTKLHSTAAEVPVAIVAGASGAVVSSAQLKGANARDFRLVADHCLGVRLAPGGHCELAVSATPIAVGKLSADLMIGDESGARTTVALGVESKR